MLQKAQTALSLTARRAFFDKHPVAAVAISALLFGLPCYWLLSWIESDPLNLFRPPNLALHTLFKGSDAVLGPHGVFLATLLVGLILYTLRQRMRALYAIVELCFGAIAASVAATRIYLHTPSSFTLNEQFALYTTLIAALYVIVRGWENLSKVIDTDPHASRLKPFWQSWFGKP